MVAACPFPAPRGTPLRIQRMAEALAERGHEVHVVTYHLGVGEPSPALRIHRTRRLPLRGALAPGPTPSKLLLDPLLARLLRRVIATHAIDVVHAHHYEGLGVALAASRRGARAVEPPIIYDAHTLLATELPDYGLAFPRGLARSVGARIDRGLPRRATHVVAVTERLRARLVAGCGVDADRTTVVPNGVERAFLDACRAAIAARAAATSALSSLPRAHSSPRPPARLVYGGNLAPYQGIDLMMASLAEIRRARPDARLRVVIEETAARRSRGGAESAQSAAARCGVADAVEVIACDSGTLAGELVASEIALNPRPRADGFAIKSLNYMAAGRPTVAFAEAAGPLEDGVTGILVGEPTPEAFARAVLRLLDDPALAARLGRAAHETVATRFTWESVAETLEGLYTRILEADADMHVGKTLERRTRS
jgi:glycosyltransferase involved in cell wall biosynthesis